MQNNIPKMSKIIEKTYFECKIIQGHTIKILLEILHYKLKNVKFFIMEEAIYLSESDGNKNNIHCEIFLDRNKFMYYKFTDSFAFSINIPSFISIISNVKAGNSLEIKIISREEEDNPHKRQFYLLTNSYNKNDSHNKEDSEILIQPEDLDGMTPFIDRKFYREHPVNIESSSLKYLKKIKSSKKPITISIQYKNIGVSLKVLSELTTLSRHFGGFVPGEPCDFIKEFDSSLIIPISKISNLSLQVSFYTMDKNFDNYSLKISSNINELGYFNFYIKDINQIEFEKSIIH
jgi:hypothetical protein